MSPGSVFAKRFSLKSEVGLLWFCNIPLDILDYKGA